MCERNSETIQRITPCKQMDHWYLRRADCEDKITVLFQKDSDSIRSQIVELKGVKCEEAIEAALKGIREFGHHGKIALKADGENTVKALKGGFSIQTAVMSMSPKLKSSKDFFVCTSCIGAQNQRHIPIHHTILCWLVEFVGDLAPKYLAGVDGKTGYERLKKVREEQLEFGEVVLWRKPQLQDCGVVADTRWETEILVNCRPLCLVQRLGR